MEAYALSIRERSELLDSLKWSKDLTGTQIEQLARFLLVFSVKKDETVFHEAEEAAYMGLIAKGKLRVVKEGSAKTARNIAILGPGSAFGEMSLIDGEPRSASIYAEEDALLLFLTDDNFYALIEEFPQIGVQILLSVAQAMSQRLRLTSGWLVEALSHNSESPAAPLA